MIKGIDISKWNPVNDFGGVYKDGFEFVILRAGGNNGGFYTDPKFYDYYNGAKAAGLKVGCYYDTGRNFKDTYVGYQCAVHFKDIIKGMQFEMPIYADIETVATCHRAGATQCFKMFATVLEESGYFVGCYASDISGFKDRLILKELENRYTLWVARYGKKPEYVKNCDMWQKRSNGFVSGIQGNVDIDVCYKDFTSIIKKKGLNGY